VGTSALNFKRRSTTVVQKIRLVRHEQIALAPTHTYTEVH